MKFDMLSLCKARFWIESVHRDDSGIAADKITSAVDSGRCTYYDIVRIYYDILLLIAKVAT